MTVKIIGERVILKSIEDDDIPVIWKLIYGTENTEWKKWDAPYFPLNKKTLEEYRKSIHTPDSYDSIAKLGIWVSKDLIGTVGYYWEHKASNWLEIGISIYDEQYWSKGYGLETLKIWINHLFKVMPLLVRVGLTTWSGNIRMLKCAEKLGMKQEARLRKCRLWQLKYYDSIRYGILLVKNGRHNTLVRSASS